MGEAPLSSRESLREGGSILKDAILNQYQAIIGLGIGAVSMIAASPLPVLFWLGAELVLLPLIDSPPVRRLVARKRLERRRIEWQQWREQAVASLSPEHQDRYWQMAGLCEQIEANYQSLNGISRIYLTEQREKLDHILTSCLHRMLALAAYEHTISARRPESLQKEIAQLERELQDASMPERARAAVAKNIELKQTLLASLQDARGSRKALETELDSSYSVLEVLLQKSISMRDPEAISAELDSIVHQAEESERSVREMESLMRSSGVDFATETMDRLEASRGSTVGSAEAGPHKSGSAPSRVKQR
jgi:hypothetical protein